MLYFIFFLLLAAALAVLLLPVWKNSDLPLTTRKYYAGGVGALFIFGAAGFYSLLGAPGILPVLADYNQKMAGLRENISKHSYELKANPKDLAAWVGLGQNFMESGDYTGAVHAFRQAVKLSQGNPLLILAYATAMISEADGKVTDDAKQSLDMVLLQQPQNPEARYLLAVRQLQDGHTQQAMKDMKELYHSLPDDSPLKAMIDQQIGKK